MGTYLHCHKTQMWALAMLCIVSFLLPQMANAEALPYYETFIGPNLNVRNSASGIIEVDFLTYDDRSSESASLSRYDRFLTDMEIYVTCGGIEMIVYQHSGGYRKWDGYTQDRYGADKSLCGAKAERLKTWCDDGHYYKRIKLTLPNYIWGKSVQFRYKGVYRYRYNKDTDDEKCVFDYQSEHFNTGDVRFNVDPKISSAGYAPKAQTLTVTLDDLPNLDAANNIPKAEVVLSVNGENPQTYDVTQYSKHSLEYSPKGLDCSKDVTLKAEVKVTYGTNKWSKSIEKTVQRIASPTIVRTEYNTINRFVAIAFTPTLVDVQNGANMYGVYRKDKNGSEWSMVGYGYLYENGNEEVVKDYGHDSPLESNKQYDYRVQFYRSCWNREITDTSELPCQDNVTVSTAPKLDMSLTGEVEDHKVHLSWSVPHHPDFNGCKVEIYREGGSAPIHSETYFNRSTGSWIDEGNDLGTGEPMSGVFKYYFKLTAHDTWYKTDFTSDVLTVNIVDAATIKRFKASQGDYAGKVRLEWDVKNYLAMNESEPRKTTYNLLRRIAVSGDETQDSAWEKLYTTSSNTDYLVWDDDTALPGLYYEYKIDGEARATDEQHTRVPITANTVGYARSTGVITGSVTFGSGQAVPQVKVVAIPGSESNDITSSRCLLFSGNGASAVWSYDASKKEKYWGGDFTLQMWVNPFNLNQGLLSSTDRDAESLVNINDRAWFRMARNIDGTYVLSTMTRDGDATPSGDDLIAGIPSEVYSHLTIVRRGDSITATVRTGNDGKIETRRATIEDQLIYYTTESPAAMRIGGGLHGTIDEMRVWTRALSDDEVEENYNRSLTGDETGLVAYWRFDEGLETMFFDSSRSNKVNNGNSGVLESGVKTSRSVPGYDLLGYRATTDDDGSYIIEGIPFAGDGTSYNVIPTLGIHEFSPKRQRRYVGPSSLVHNSTDFEDVSSFPVSGVIYYSNTTYPVEECEFYVDGIVCSRDGKIVHSATDGTFTIDVPIGSHFIEVRKTGHTFESGGRYPADPDGVRTTTYFDHALYNLTFSDNTLLHLTGRVTGGDVEGEKLLGNALSKTTIGKARITLRAQDDKGRLNAKREVDGTVVTYKDNDTRLDVDVASELCNTVKSKAWRGAGEQCRRIYIETDSITGEYSAMLPPLMYVVEKAEVIATGQQLLAGGELQQIDLTQPLITATDSATIDEKKLTVDYNANYKLTHYNQPLFKVMDVTCPDSLMGAFGVKKVKYVDAYGEFTIDNIYEIDATTKKVKYNYGGGVPMFKTRENYVFAIDGYEEYLNYDLNKDKPTSTRVPLAGAKVTINNDLSADQAVVTKDESGEISPGTVINTKSNELVLDSLGRARYTWLGGLPNITAPYTRTISIDYTIGNRHYSWEHNGMEAILLGAITTGTNFVTKGPDIPQMILRDPPGSRSSARWEKGTIEVRNTINATTGSSDIKFTTDTHFGTDTQMATGFISLAQINTVSTKGNLIAGIYVKANGYSGDVANYSYSVTDAISTSSDPSLVGSAGDVIIGRGTNLTFGKARSVEFKRESKNDTPVLGENDVIDTGLTFETFFSYTQYYIENTLLPNLQEILDDRLVYMADTTEIKNYTNNSTKPIYLTPHKKGESGYGKLNVEGDERANAITNKKSTTDGPHYWMIIPKDSTDSAFRDEVAYIIESIESWKNILAMNERDKVEAQKDVKKYFKENYSFDGGTSVTHIEKNDTTIGTKYSFNYSAGIIAGGKWGYTFNNTGIISNLETETGGGIYLEGDTLTTETATFAYTFAEDGPDDALTVDVYSSPAKFAPIFRTRAGQTSAPYEGEEKTKYYEKGQHTLNVATMSLERPSITADVPSVNDVPSGGAANFTLHMSNQADVSNARTFVLKLLDQTNNNGAILLMDGTPLADGRNVRVPAEGRLTKSLQLKQSDQAVLDYENIGITLSAVNAIDATAIDTLFLSAHFVPSSSPVELKIASPVVNTSTGTNLIMVMQGYDRNYLNLSRFKLQYKEVGSNDWVNFHEYVLNASDVTTNNELLPTDKPTVTYTLDMNAMADGNYVMRAVSYSKYGTEEVARQSEEVMVTKDTRRPSPIAIPSPTDGILNAGDEISVTFNEDILPNHLNNADNFKIVGRLNDAEVSHDGVFHSSGGEGARTQANIDLTYRSFTITQWVKWTDAGSIIHHGTTNGMDIAVDADGHLVVTMDGSTITSEAQIPREEWSCIVVTYNYNNGKPFIDANVHYSNSDVTLIDHEDMVKYSCNGALTVGRGINASIHEVTLWDSAIDYNLLRTEINNEKPASTSGLIGYWHLDEGHGNTGEDVARYRHMTLPEGDNWSMASVNHALELNGKNFARLDMTKSNTYPNENYMLEMWVKSGEHTDDATIFSMGNRNPALTVSQSGLTLCYGGTSKTFNVQNFFNDSWHHVALNVLKGTQGMATLYIDGAAVAQVPAQSMPEISTDRLVLGASCSVDDITYKESYSNFFNGAFDEIRLWRGTFCANTIREQMHSRVSGDAPGLIAYYPLESITLDQFNQAVTSPSLADISRTHANDAVVLTPEEDGSYTGTNNWHSTNTPSMKLYHEKENIAFSFTASERKILINLNTEEQRIEGCNVEITVNDVQDIAGNRSQPVTWTALVNRNQLSWERNEISLTKESDEALAFDMTFTNNASSETTWNITGMPMWLTTDNESGTLAPLSSKTIKLSVVNGTDIGHYEAVMGLKGDNGVTANLVVNLTVIGQRPDWQVDVYKYEHTMNAVGLINIEGIISEDTNDMVAAFIDGECRGVGSPSYVQRYDSYYVLMNIYGDASNDGGKEIKYKIYDASTGEIYPAVDASGAATFQEYNLCGSFTQPVEWTTNNTKEQSQILSTGWNWISLYVQPQNMSVESVFHSVEDVTSIVKNKTLQAVNYDGWMGTLKQMGIGQMYKVKTSADANLCITGTSLTPSDIPVSIESGWNWIGYTSSGYTTVNEAFAALDPKDGDIVKGRNAFAIYMDYEWIGSLEYLQPGQGYVYYSVDEASKTFTYPNAKKMPHMMARIKSNLHYMPCDEHKYQGNMTIIAECRYNGEPIDCEIACFDSQDECRASSMTEDNNKLVFLTVQGDGAGEKLYFRAVFEQDGKQVDCKAKETCTFSNDEMIGTPLNPFIINIGDDSPTIVISGVTGENLNDDYYDIMGRRVSQPSHGVYVRDGKKVVRK